MPLATLPLSTGSPAEAPKAQPQKDHDQTNMSQASPNRNTPIGLGGTGEISNRPAKLGTSRVSFPVKSTGKVYLKKPGVILPTGSYVKATLLTGVEAPEGRSYPVLLQLDFAHIVPNDKKLDLSGCFMIAKAQGDLSTERVQMQATKLSCVSKRSGIFEREINGFVADDADNSFAVMGRVNSKQERVASTAFLSSIVAGIGRAIQQAQTTSQTTPLGGSQSVVTGDQGKFIAAGGAAEAATMVTQWYLKQAQNLLPTINVGSGQNVWVIMQDQVDLPKEYFVQNGTSDGSGGVQNASIYSYFTRVIE
jgi:conjugal transfer pilus assembly protein TraB